MQTSDGQGGEQQYLDRYYSAADGLRLHYRDYAADSDLPPVICLHGLTRTCRDYESLAPYLNGSGTEAAGERRRVIVPDLRGHGASEYSREAEHYTLSVWADDIVRLLRELKLGPAVIIGTSLGGLLLMQLAHQRCDGADIPQICGALINDIGPEIELAGLMRIGENAGLARSYPTWMHAARALMASHRHSFPDYDIQRWIMLAKRNMVVGQNGRIMPDHDLAVAEPLAALFADGGGDGEGEALAQGIETIHDLSPVPLWEAFDALSGTALTIIRGAFSDILASETVTKMVERSAGAVAVEVPRLGHTPALDEELALAAIDSLLARAKPS